MGKVVERIVNAERVEDLITVFGSFDENIKRIEEALNVRVVNRGTDLRVSGDEEMADKAVRTLEGLLSLAAKGETIDEQRVRYLITLVNEGNDAQVAQMAKDVVCITAKGKPIKAKTVGQQNYMKAIMKNTITIGVGPAGTGKTYLAVAEAVAAIRQNYMALYGVEELSEQLGVTKSHLVRVFKQEMGVPPGKYMTNVRIEAVKTLLLTDEYNLDMIAGLTGFSGANYLCRVFKREVGLSPAAWRTAAAPLPAVPKLPPRSQEMYV